MTEGRRSSEEHSVESEQDQYIQNLEQYRRRLDGAMFAGDLAWWEMDVETGAVTFHENKADMLGYSPAEFDHYEDFTELVHPDDYEGAMDAMRDHLEGRAERYDTEYRIQTASGEYRWFHDVGGITERRDNGSPRKVTGVVIDITRRKTVEQNLRERNEQLSLLNRIVRHDIRNDMSVIQGWADVLQDELSPENRDILARIQRASRHTTGLTEDVRDLMTVLGEEGTTVELQPVDVVRVIEDEAERVRQTFDDAEVQIRSEQSSVDVRANAMLSSLIGNLLSNAVQHNDESAPKITIDTVVQDESVIVTIADNGPGIPDEQRDRIFEQETKGLNSDGTGLGLYLVGTLVDIYGGEISAADNEPKGTVFTIRLERAPER
ncbi:PAS domain-containing sensor histidine kinase [Haloferax sp. ATB1]|uniref:PAS domain-containing sensor histidine kinase n=1 Tax=Haloferax sp. ATB1 TaxID=1508454 RepID=UPI0006946744|nr:PAS domain-containing sensor histidine kinase [Haloferax sp. ATB1]